MKFQTINDGIALIDSPSLYYFGKKRYEQSVINYEKLDAIIGQYISESSQRIIFGTDYNGTAKPFIKKLTHLGYICKFKPVLIVNNAPIPTMCDVELTLAALMAESKIVVLCSSNFSLIPLVQHLIGRGIKVIIIGLDATNIFSALGATVVDLPLEVLNAPAN